MLPQWSKTFDHDFASSAVSFGFIDMAKVCDFLLLLLELEVTQLTCVCLPLSVYCSHFLYMYYELCGLRFVPVLAFILYHTGTVGELCDYMYRYLTV